MGASAGGPAAHDRSRPPRPQALRRYGQNHLVDLNLLRAIVDQAAVGPGDVVLEVGAAGGLLTRPLLDRAAVVHAFEIDRRWLPRLEELAATDARLRLHPGDALRADLTALDPPPTALVANLAYNIAIPLIMTSIAGLPSIRRWAVMVQRELGERLFAAPSTKAYAAVSVLTQLACRLEKVRPVPATAFRPRPRVESSFLTFVRRDPAAAGSAGAGGAPGPGAVPDQPTGAPDPAGYEAVSRLVRVAFGQRRKTLANTLGGAAFAGRTLGRDEVRRALAGIGEGEAARPEELSPSRWLAFAVALGAAESGGAGSRSEHPA